LENSSAFMDATLAAWEDSLMSSIPLGGLLSRNPIAYKWKAPFRCWLVREAVFWRITDLLMQSNALYKADSLLGARILLRSAIETTATLIFLNQQIQQVIVGNLDFHEFGRKTSILALGSRNKTTSYTSINIVTVLEKCNKRYPGLQEIYANMSESAHPNYEGLVVGFSKVDHAELETHFSNRWSQLYGKSHANSMELCASVFEYEYNKVWIGLMTQLEDWIVQNDEILEATKSGDVTETRSQSRN
jgi:hypothetical protein